MQLYFSRGRIYVNKIHLEVALLFLRYHFFQSSSVLCTLSLSNALDVVVKFSKSEIKEMKSLPSLQRCVT